MVNGSIRFITLQSDAYSLRWNKGEMTVTVIWNACKWQGQLVGWSKWTCTESKTMLSHSDEAKIIIENMKQYDIIPSILNDNFIESSSTKKIIVLFAGDGLYENAVDLINAHLQNECGDLCQMFKEVSGDAHIDDAHVNMHAYKEAVKGDETTKAAHKIFRKCCNALIYLKSNGITKDIHNEGINYQTIPKQSYVTHLSSAIKSYHENYQQTVAILEKIAWDKLDALKSSHLVVELWCIADVCADTFTVSLKTFQRSQNYRGYRETADART